MISITELNPKAYKLDSLQASNLQILLHKINQIRIIYNKPMVITSGVRTKEDQIRIYKEIADRNNKQFELSKVPMNSMHLIGAACDVLDLDGSLMKWCKNNSLLLEQIGLWIEDDVSQPRVHFQIYPPKSGNRFFKP